MLLGEWFRTFPRKVTPSFSMVKQTKKKYHNGLYSVDKRERSDLLVAGSKSWQANRKVGVARCTDRTGLKKGCK
jgi:hypothetical protein